MTGLVLGLLLNAADTRAAEGLFTPETTVVVLSGIPGDVESESAYEGQLARLLEALAATRVHQVLLLTDSPERVRIPSGLSARALPGSRTRFLGLADDLAGSTGPVTIVAWGHAGQQGTTPVFHVRGPRLAPTDFSTAAARLGKRPSRWLLFFRGSGAFAQALRAEGREILSSDHDVAFRSDPVGMDLFLRLVGDAPHLDAPTLAERLGRATGQWYAGQKLARTEEPTLWRGMDPPRTLTADTSRLGDAASRGTAEATPTERASPVPAPSVAPKAGIWAEIRPVDATGFPGAAAVVLRRVHRFVLGRSPALTQEVDEFIQVLTEEGKSRGDFDVAYSPPEEKLSVLDAEVLRPDGVLERLDADAIHEGGAPMLPEGYRAPARKVFSLPAVTPGAILRVHYRTEWRHFPLPEILLEVPLASELALVDFTVEVQVATQAAFHHAFADATAREPVVERSAYGVTHRWRFENVPPLVDEVLSRPGGGPRLVASTFPDWATFAAWYRRLVKEADVITPEIASRAAELTRGARTDLEKVVALYNYVTSLRYVAIPLGVNSHRPHAAANVLKNRYGDCKDKANLFNTLLRTQGIAADLVLVPRFSQAHDAVPGAGFNHAISRVHVAGQTIWVDTTDDVSRFGLLPPGDPGRKVLVIDGASKSLTFLPAPEPEAHRLVVEGSFAVGADETRGHPGAIEAKATGYADYALRSAARQAAGQTTTRPILAEGYRPATGLLAMESQEHTPAGALDRDFVWSAKGSWSGVTNALPARGRSLRAPFWLPREWESAIHQRTSPLFLNDGYPLKLDERFVITLPRGAAKLVVPPPRWSQGAPLRYDLRWSSAGDGRLEASLHLELVRGELDAAVTAAFQAQLRSLLAALGEGATFDLEP